MIIGGGIVGLSIANELKEKHPELYITVLEKENTLGMHTSGRNSGVIHAGIYYKPGSIKSKVCVKGAIRLKEWCIKENIQLLKCGKLISPSTPEEDLFIDVLFKRGKQNGAYVQIIDNNEIQKLIPGAYSHSGRAIWSPNTYVVNPKNVITKLYENLTKKNVKFLFNKKIKFIDTERKKVSLNCSAIIKYKHIFNTSGLNAVSIAKKFNLSKNRIVLPFKGLYFELKNNLPYQIKRNLYPVPDLELPFLGVHFTPTLEGNTIIGPTAIPALGKENYRNFNEIEFFESFRFAKILMEQFLKNESGFRKYALEQANLGIKFNFYKSAKKLFPKLEMNHIQRCHKVGIRPQLFDIKEKCLIDDFILEKDENSTHVVNAISPAFTACFELADLILKESLYLKSL